MKALEWILLPIALAIGICLIPIGLIIALSDFIYSMKDAKVY